MKACFKVLFSISEMGLQGVHGRGKGTSKASKALTVEVIDPRTHPQRLFRSAVHHSVNSIWDDGGRKMMG